MTWQDWTVIFGLPLMVAGYVELTSKIGRRMGKMQRPIGIALLVIGTLIYVVDIADRLGGFDYIAANLPVTEVYGQTFVSEDVPLAGYGYHHCRFVNVTFVVTHSTRKSEFRDNIIEGKPIFTTDDPAALRIMRAATSLGLANISIVTRYGDKILPGSGLGKAPPF